MLFCVLLRFVLLVVALRLFSFRCVCFQFQGIIYFHSAFYVCVIHRFGGDPFYWLVDSTNFRFADFPVLDLQIGPSEFPGVLCLDAFGIWVCRFWIFDM